MLKIINNLKPFFEDCYRRISVREYSKILKVSPPTASKILNRYYKEGLLKMEKDRNYLFFYAERENKVFIQLSRMYWSYSLGEMVDYLNKALLSPTIILFGSLSKGEAKKDSDVDIAVFANKKELNIKKFEKKLGRKIQIFWFKYFNEVKEDIKNNIINGHVIEGKIKI